MPAVAAFDVFCLGHAAFDLTLAVAHHPDGDEKMVADGIQLCGGGPSANAAVAVSRLGGRAGWSGYLGRDIFGEAHRQELIAADIDLRWLVRGEAPSPISAILAKPDGHRSVVNYKGQTPWLAADAADFAAVRAGCILLDGHEPLLSATLMAHAKAHGIPTLLDAGSRRRGTEELAPQVDYLAASRRFALDYCGTNDAHAALKQLAAIAPQVAITLGRDGLLWARGREFGEMAAFPVAVIDSTGAGDAFHGAMALGVARGMDWLDLLRFASAVGALACTQLGARTAIPGADAVAQFLAERGQPPLSA